MTVGLDDDVPDVARVVGRAIEQPPVKHHASPDAGRDHHGHEVGDASRSPAPSLAKGESFRVVVEIRREAEVRLEARP